MKNVSSIQHPATKILIIDDEPKIVDSICEALEKEGHKMFSANNGKKGLEIHKRENPVLIILDLRMPEMDGIAFLEHIKPKPSDPYSVIVLTGHGKDDDIKICFKLGISAFVRKPFNIFELRGVVRQAIDLKHDQQELLKVNIELGLEIDRHKQTEKSLFAQLRLEEFIAYVNSIIVEGSTLNTMLGKCAEAMLQNLGAAFVRIWTFNEDDNMLELQASAGMYTDIDGVYSRIPLDKCKAGLIIDRERKSDLTRSSIDDPETFDQEWVKREGVTGFAGHPLIIGDRLVGIIAAFSMKPTTIAGRQMIKLVSNGIALGIYHKRAERKIRRLATFPELNCNPVLELDSCGTIIFYNEATAKALSSVGLNDKFDLFVPKDIKELIASFKNKKDQHTYREIEIGDLTFDEYLHFVQEFNVVRIYTRDITEHKRIEMHLSKQRKQLQVLLRERITSEERFKNLVNTIPDIVYRIDANGYFDFINNAVRSLGYEPSELIGKHFSEIIYTDDVDAVSCSIVLPKYAGMKTGDKDQPKLFDERRSINRMTKGLEVRLVKKKEKETKSDVTKEAEDNVIIAEVNSTGIHQINLDTDNVEFVGAYGVINQPRVFNGTTGIMRDITERKRIEDQLRKLTTAVEQSPSVVMITDMEGDIEYVNPKFTSITGYTVEEAIGKNPRILKSGMQSHETYKQLWSTITSGKEWQGDLHNRKKNGEVYWEAAYISPIRDTKGIITNYIKVAEDITHRKFIEDELMKSKCELEERVAERTSELEATHEQLIHSEKLSAIGKLSASIAHEFNNPIFGILNILERLRDDVPMDNANKDFVKLAIRECDRISELIRKLQDFYRPSSDEMVLVDIHEVVEDVLMLMQKKLKMKKIELIKDYTSKTSIIKVVPDQIKQVLLNILNNAEQAIPDGGGEIYISIENHKTEIKINIHDTGVGIKDKDIKSIFEPFYTTKAIKGSGLGLSVSYGIIKHHGGDIKVKSRPGKGTTFSITLPVTGDAGGGDKRIKN